MDLADEILSRVRGAETQAAAAVPTEAELESLRVATLEQLALVPEPPAYRRAGDPSREKAQARLPGAEALLLRAGILRKGASGTRLEAQSEAIRSGLEAQVVALASIAQGQIVRGEDEARRAQELSHAINELSAAFHRVDEKGVPVFDRTKGESRYDPHPTSHLEVTLPCPNPACRKVAIYSLTTRSSTHRFHCTACKVPFLGYFGEVRSIEQSTVSRGLHYALRLDEIGGHDRTVEFDDASGGHLPVAPHDLVALLSTTNQRLVAVENLSTARVLWVQGRDSCFLVTAAFGEGAPELATFRSFRDRVLLPHPVGRLGVAVYYRVGPHLARLVVQSPATRSALRSGLERLLPLLRAGES